MVLWPKPIMRAVSRTIELLQSTNMDRNDKENLELLLAAREELNAVIIAFERYMRR